MEKELATILNRKPNDHRKHKTNVWHKDGISYATNGKIAVFCQGEYGIKDDGDFPDLSAFLKLDEFKNLPDGYPINLEYLAKNKPCDNCSADITKPQTAQCNECYGTGEVECYECGHEHDCDDCNGTGRKVITVPRIDCGACSGSGIDSDATVFISDHNMTFSASILAKVNTITGVKYYPGHRLKSYKEFQADPLVFSFGGGGFGVIMPMTEETFVCVHCQNSNVVFKEISKGCLVAECKACSDKRKAK